MFVELKCPACGGACEIDESRELAFCQYCGTKMINDKASVSVSGTVSIDTKMQIKNLLERASRFENEGDNGRAVEYYNRVLDMDPENGEAADGERRSRGIVDFDNVAITVGETLKRSAAIYLIVDENEKYSIHYGEAVSLRCNVGVHSLSAFTALLPERSEAFEINTTYDEKEIIVEKNLFGIKILVRNTDE